MGQRLNIEMMYDDRVIANCYYHWSADHESASYLVNKIVSNAELSNCTSEEEYLAETVRLLELTGGGIDAEERKRIMQDFAGRFGEIEFKDAVSRDEGLISVSEEGIERTRYFEDGRVEIHLDKKFVKSCVCW